MRKHVLRRSLDSFHGISLGLRKGIADVLYSRPPPPDEFQRGLKVPIHILPAADHKLFGRSHDMDAVHACLEGQRDSIHSQPRTCIVSGMAGVCKSALTREYVKKHKDVFDIVCWIRSDTHNNISLAYHDLRKQLQVPGHDTLTFKVEDLERVTDWLSNCGKQLLLRGSVESRLTPQISPGCSSLTTSTSRSICHVSCRTRGGKGAPFYALPKTTTYYRTTRVNV